MGRSQRRRPPESYYGVYWVDYHFWALRAKSVGVYGEVYGYFDLHCGAHITSR